MGDHPDRPDLPANAVNAATMPDQCHAVCVKLDPLDDRIYFPYAWVHGVGLYECEHGHHWTCGWGHRTSGLDLAQRRLAYRPGQLG